MHNERLFTYESSFKNKLEKNIKILFQYYKNTVFHLPTYFAALPSIFKQ